MLGDTRFFAALRDYLHQCAYRNASTQQFFAAIDKSLGTDLTWFENEWFFRAAYPRYYVTDSYDGASHALTLEVAQRNADRRPFRMPVAIEVYSGGHVVRIEAIIDRNEQTVIVPHVAAAPVMVLFDPNNNVLRMLTFAKSVHELAYQIAHAPHVGDREWALRELAADENASSETRSKAASAVRHAVASDPFWGMRADAVGVAAAFGDTTSVQGALRDSDVRVRLAAEDAAANLRGQPSAIISELDTMANDPDPNVAAGALASLGALKAPGTFVRLVAALERPSFRQTVATGALRGLAAYGDGRGCALIQERTAYGTQEQERKCCCACLSAVLAAGKGCGFGASDFA